MTTTTKDPLRIAVADDEADIREYLEKMLPRMGYQVVAVAENGRELVDLCRASHPDLIISDLRMPEMDGDEAVRKLGGTIPFIAISAFSIPDGFGNGLIQGRWRYLHKPVTRRDLEEAIASLFPSQNQAPEFAAPTKSVPASVHPAMDADDTARARRATAKPVTISARPLDVLIVDDDAEFVQDMVTYFQRNGHRAVGCHDGIAALEQADLRAFDVAVVDMAMPGMSGMELLQKMKANHPECELVMLTGHGTIELAVEAMKHGAFDFLTKPIRLSELEAVVARASDTNNLRRENRQLRAALHQQSARSSIIGQSRAMEDIFRLLQRIGATENPVLIEGESGTGKELVARAIHAASSLRDMPLVVVNCAALPETLLESELFGHEKGAFTGAVAAKPGLFEVADGGTLFIDEIGELAGSLQAKLLRVLEDGSLRRIGSVKERRVRVRLIAATNRDMLTEVKEMRFREDLYYRINVLTMVLPPMRERKGDIELLVRHFAGADWQLADGLIPELERYSWPGNVRQLANAIERAKILADDEVIRLENFPPEILRYLRSSHGTETATLSDDLESRTRNHVMEAYERCDHNKARTARMLGIGRRSLYRLLEKYGIHEPSES